jgi:hypothetical protein
MMPANSVTRPEQFVYLLGIDARASDKVRRSETTHSQTVPDFCRLLTLALPISKTGERDE